MGTRPGAPARRRSALVSLSARGKARQDLRRRLGERGDGRGIPGLGQARRRADAARPRWIARAALARERGRMGLCAEGALPGHHHRSARPVANRRFRSGRRLVFPARLRAFDPGARPGRLPVRARLRQRLFLGVRHLQHHRLARPYAGRGAGEEFRRAGAELSRTSPSAKSISRRVPSRRRCRPTPRPVRSTAARAPIATSSWRSAPTHSPAGRCASCPSASFRSPRR